METDGFWHLTSEKTVWGDKGGNFEEKNYRKPKKNKRKQRTTLFSSCFCSFLLPPCLPPTVATPVFLFVSCRFHRPRIGTMTFRRIRLVKGRRLSAHSPARQGDAAGRFIWSLKRLWSWECCVQKLIVVEMFSMCLSINCGFPAVWFRKCWFRKVREVYRIHFLLFWHLYVSMVLSYDQKAKNVHDYSSLSVGR